MSKKGRFKGMLGAVSSAIRVYDDRMTEEKYFKPIIWLGVLHSAETHAISNPWLKMQIW
jgi:hypothetical protein